MTSIVRRAPLYAFDSESGIWGEAEGGEGSIRRVRQRSSLRFRLAQLNVLFDRRNRTVYKPNVCFAGERYDCILGTLFDSRSERDRESEDYSSDLVCAFNEVTTEFLDRLKAREDIQEHYYLSNIEGFGTYFGNVLVSSIPFRAVYVLELAESTGPHRPIIVGILSHLERRRDDEEEEEGEREYEECDCVAIVNMHATAHYSKVERRRLALLEVFRILRTHEVLGQVKNVIVLGDLNFHSELENAHIVGGYSDAWLEIHPDLDDPGFTFDAKKNLMLREMWPLGWVIGFDMTSFQVRLDRWLVNRRSDSCQVQLRNLRVWANEPVYSPSEESQEDVREEEEEIGRRTNWFQDLVETISDELFAKNAFRDRKESFLFPSDHFGLRAEVTVGFEDELLAPSATRSRQGD